MDPIHSFSHPPLYALRLSRRPSIHQHPSGQRSLRRVHVLLLLFKSRPVEAKTDILSPLDRLSILPSTRPPHLSHRAPGPSSPHAPPLRRPRRYHRHLSFIFFLFPFPTSALSSRQTDSATSFFPFPFPSSPVCPDLDTRLTLFVFSFPRPLSPCSHSFIPCQ